MPTVKFNDVEEFLEELKRDASLRSRIDRNIVRVTMSRTPTKISPNISHLSVIATYSVNGQIIRLDRYCGDLWGLKQDSDEAVIKKAETIIADTEALCRIIQLDCRPGVIEEQ